jgi:peroxiredoxin
MILAGFSVVLVISGCGDGSSKPKPVQSVIRGHITVDAEVDASTDYSGFDVLVVRPDGRTLDTLGQATTKKDGSYQAVVTAPERGIYPLVIRRRGNILLRTDYVVAQDDTASMNIVFPFTGNYVPIRSPENSALIALRNTMGLHRQRLMQRIQRDVYAESTVSMNVRQTSSILWGMRDNYPGMYATQIASVESLALLESWNDSLVVARAGQIEPANPRYVTAGQIARRSQARVAGQESAISLLKTFEENADREEDRAALQAEQVRAYIDSLQEEEALAAADRLSDEHAGTQWAEWAERARYEVENLLPGKPAPSITAPTMQGDTVSLDALRGYLVVLEFYHPRNEVYQQQIPTRNALYEATRTDSVAFVSVSMEPDSLLNRAFFDGRTLPGQHVIAADGSNTEIVKQYNVASVPVRYLIDRDGRIVDKYPGSTFFAMQDAITKRLSERPDRRISPQPPAATPPTSR